MFITRGSTRLAVARAAGYMARRNMRGSGFDVACLVVKEKVGFELTQKFALG